MTKLYKIEDFLLDANKRQFFYQNQNVTLSSRAFDILLYLVERNGEVIEKDALLEAVWSDSFVEESNLAVHISALRRVLHEKKGEAKFIRTISGRGYSFVAPIEEIDSVQDFREQFKTRKKPLPEEKLALAVLPFTFKESQPDNEYLADGITRSLISELSQIQNLKVLAYSATEKFRKSELELQEIGFLLDADKLLTGHISEYKGKVEIVVELINAKDKTCIWGTEQTFEADDIFKVKSRIATRIAEKLKLKLNVGADSGEIGANEISAKAQKLYFRGKFVLESRTTKKKPEDVLFQALKFFQEAVKIEPNYALAYVGIGRVYVSLHNHNLMKRDKAFAEAKKALQFAMYADDCLSEVYVLKVAMEVMFEMKFDEAEKSLIKAFELNPSDPGVYYWESCICLYFGKFEEALNWGRKATELDPTSMYFNDNLTRIFFHSGDYNKAIIQAEELLEFDDKSVTSLFFIALSYAQLGAFENALEKIEKAIELRYSAETLLNKAYIYGIWGKKDQAETILTDVLGQTNLQADSTDVAAVYGSIGDIDKLFLYLNQALAERNTNLGLLKIDPRFSSVMKDKRFQDILIGLNLQ